MTAGSYELDRHADRYRPFAGQHRAHQRRGRARRATRCRPTRSCRRFPPANAEGAFGDRLPQIVLKRRTLPWERNPFGAVECRRRRGSPSSWSPRARPSCPASRDRSRECVTPGVALRDPADADVDQGYCLTVTETVVKKMFPARQDLRAADPRARGRRHRHRAGQRRRRRLPRRRARQPAAACSTPHRPRRSATWPA